ncbi:hypothetical protein POJ06DRAFT_261501 [Lipomyces tetrasporus]|uniref:Protein kinase domain-containing protein n=1 Tax=Lipomyces tetrasporus TaxID=54092 RepID=A0AAD7QLN1_9ASCO|nr:uncharacterized protein POJ06DRAFT_261501 [Lipomyces tetrasporus]KAJ8097483.1 hypothetical protein POJ06DRAFT_261501 [Lipomyces tetrasporus]
MSRPHTHSASGSASVTSATTSSTSSRPSFESSSSSLQLQQQQGSATLHRDFRPRQQRRPISVAMSSSDYQLHPAFAGSHQSSSSGSGFHYSSTGGSYSSIDLDSRHYSRTHPSRRDSGDSVETSSITGKKSSSGSSFMGGLFHIGRKPKGKEDGNVSPAKATSGKIISGGGGTVVFSGNNFSDTHLVNGGARLHGTHVEASTTLLQQQHQQAGLKPPERTVRKQSSGLILPTVAPVNVSPPLNVPAKMNTTPPKRLDTGLSVPSASPPGSIVGAAPGGTKKILIFCTTDHEHFVLINVSGMATPELVRCAVSEKLRLDGAILYFYITELGEFERGEPLSDDELIEACRRADSKGTVKFFVRVVGQHYQSAPDVMMYQSNALAKQQSTNQKSPLLYQQQPPMRRRQISPSGLIQPNLRVNTAYSERDTKYSPSVTQQVRHRHSSVGLKEDRLEAEQESKFKVIQRPTPLIDFDQGRQSPYGAHVAREREFTALRNPPPPPQGRQGASTAYGRQRSTAGDDHDSGGQPPTIQPRSTSLDVSASTLVSPMTVVQAAPIDSPITTYRSQQHLQRSMESQFAWNNSYVQPEKTFSVPRKSVGSSQAQPRTPSEKDHATKAVEKGPSPPTEPPPPTPPKDDEVSPHVSPETRGPHQEVSYKSVTIEAFEENEISFADAPAFPTFDDGSCSDDDDDDGLWAKKPPSTSPAIDITSPESSIPVSLLSRTDSLSGSSTGSTSRQNSGKSNRPVLHVQIGETEIIDLSGNPMSAITERTESAKESATTPSPASAVGELPTNDHLRNSQSARGQQTPSGSSPGAYVSADVWAVRPPAEVVYDNLEKFFPNTDLDKPIIDDTPLYSPNSPAADASGSPTSQAPPLPPITAAPAPANAPLNNAVLGSANDTSLDRGFSFKSTSHGGVPDEEKFDVQPKSATAAAAAAAVAAANASESAPPPPNNKQRPITRGSRMKSIRIVAREASEARKNLSKATEAKAGVEGAALLRRKSTKMWGQRVVEVTPGQIKKGQLSVRRQGQGQQFNWVKGELIGKGTFGRVYLALNATTGEMIAVKQVDVPQTAGDKDSVKQREVVEALNAEVQTMKDLDHLNIVQYLGYEALPNVCSLFLEYVPGGSVGTCLRKHGRFERPVIHSLTRQVVDGLAYLHSKGILHRDLKSDNLLLDLDGICKISDFGISKRSQNIYSNDAEMSMQGTIFWMAPEVIHNVVHNERQGYSAKVDIWSLGCVVLEMFAGRRPWSNDEAIGAMYKLGNAKLAPPIPEDTVDYVCDDGKEFLDSCFMVDPERRPTAQVLLDSKFCMPNPEFNFAETNLAKLIKFNDKRKEQLSF